MQDMRRNVLPKFIEILYGDAMLVPIGIGTSMVPIHSPVARFKDSLNV